jgi:taurine dioxygenase
MKRPGRTNDDAGPEVGLSVKRGAGALGAFLNDVDIADVVASDELYSAVRTLAVAHEVLFLPEQHVTPSVFQRFAERFGEVLDHPAYAKLPEAPMVQILESTPEHPSKIELWHSDMTFSPTPPSFTLLHGQIIPEFGGDTLWASATAAYDALSRDMRRLLDDLVAVHDFRHGFKESLAEPGGEARLAAGVAQNPPVEHPLVRTHPESGRRALYVNPLFTTHIRDLSRHESGYLLRFLFKHLTTEEFTIRLSWRPGTIAIWDNRSTLHKPVNDFFPQHRRMHRMTIRGETPA